MKFSDVSYHLKKELELTDEEVNLFLEIVKTGMKSVDEISCIINSSHERAHKIILSLVEKKILLEYKPNYFESFHPKFAIINRYKNICEQKGFKFQKNLQIDNIATLLEPLYDDARTK